MTKTYKIKVEYLGREENQPVGWIALVWVYLPTDAQYPPGIHPDYQSPQTILGAMGLLPHWGTIDRDGDMAFAYARERLRGATAADLIESVQFRILEIETILHRVYSENTSLPPDCELTIDPSVDPVADIEIPQVSDLETEADVGEPPKSSLDLATFCDSSRLTAWRKQLAPGDWVAVWHSERHMFQVYRIVAIRPSAFDPQTHTIIKFSSSRCDNFSRVRWDYLFPARQHQIPSV